jgi:hypothetical protein
MSSLCDGSYGSYMDQARLAEVHIEYSTWVYCLLLHWCHTMFECWQCNFLLGFHRQRWVDTGSGHGHERLLQTKRSTAPMPGALEAQPSLLSTDTQVLVFEVTSVRFTTPTYTTVPCNKTGT